MQTFRLIISLGLLSLAIYIVWQVVSAYRAATGSMWERLLATAKDSARPGSAYVRSGGC